MLIKVNERPCRRGTQRFRRDDRRTHADGVAGDDRRPAEGTT